MPISSLPGIDDHGSGVLVDLGPAHFQNLPEVDHGNHLAPQVNHSADVRRRLRHRRYVDLTIDFLDVMDIDSNQQIAT